MQLKTRLEERVGKAAFIINRNEWLRGDMGPRVHTVLWNGSAGCCLGLAALVEGAPAEKLLNHSNPSDVPVDCVSPEYVAAWMDDNGDDSDSAEDTIECNDAAFITESVREDGVAASFLEARGWLVEFED